MTLTIVPRTVSFVTVLAVLFYSFAGLTGKASAQTVNANEDSGATYQIVKATEDRVWRLNVKTGEVAVCSLNGQNLICTTSAEAMTPPNMTYEEFEAAQKRAEHEKRVKQMEFMDRAIAAMRMIFATTAENGS